AVVMSFALMVAMAIMVASFRDSLDAWLGRMLPADVYLRAASDAKPGAEPVLLSEQDQQRIAALPGLRRAEFLRSEQILLAPDRPRVTLIARAIDASDAARVLPLIGPAAVSRADAPPPAWASEAAAELYGW